MLDLLCCWTCHLQFAFFFSNVEDFFFFCPIVLNRTSSIMLSGYGGSGPLCLVLILRGKYSLSSLPTLLTIDFFVDNLLMAWSFLLLLAIRHFYQAWMLDFVKCFYVLYWDDRVVFVNVVYYINSLIFLNSSIINVQCYISGVHYSDLTILYITQCLSWYMHS